MVHCIISQLKLSRRSTAVDIVQTSLFTCSPTERGTRLCDPNAPVAPFGSEATKHDALMTGSALARNGQSEAVFFRDDLGCKAQRSRFLHSSQRSGCRRFRVLTVSTETMCSNKYRFQKLQTCSCHNTTSIRCDFTRSHTLRVHTGDCVSVTHKHGAGKKDVSVCLKSADDVCGWVDLAESLL